MKHDYSWIVRLVLFFPPYIVLAVLALISDFLRLCINMPRQEDVPLFNATYKIADAYLDMIEHGPFIKPQ